MILLTANTESAIRELEMRACAYVNENGLARCGSWSAIYTDGKRFGFLWSDSLVACFDDKELGTVLDDKEAVSYTNVIEVEGEEWKQVEPPKAESTE